MLLTRNPVGTTCVTTAGVTSRTLPDWNPCSVPRGCNSRRLAPRIGAPHPPLGAPDTSERVLLTRDFVVGGLPQQPRAAVGTRCRSRWSRLNRERDLFIQRLRATERVHLVSFGQVFFLMTISRGGNALRYPPAGRPPEIFRGRGRHECDRAPSRRGRGPSIADPSPHYADHCSGRTTR